MKGPISFHAVFYIRSNTRTTNRTLIMHPEIPNHITTGESGQLGLRIREVRLSKKLTQQAFAHSLGIVQGFLCGIERGKKIPSDTLLIALSHLYEIRMEWLVSGAGEMASPPETQGAREPGAEHLTPLLRSLPDPFPERIQENDIEGYIAFPGLPLGCFGLVYSGEFMAPTIRDGDIVVLSRDEPVQHGKIILFKNHWGEPMLRRYRVRNEEIHFSADNSLYSPFKPDAGMVIIGVVIAVWRNVKI